MLAERAGVPRDAMRIVTSGDRDAARAVGDAWCASKTVRKRGRPRAWRSDDVWWRRRRWRG